MAKKINLPDEAFVEALKNATDTIDELESLIDRMNKSNDDMVDLVSRYQEISIKANSGKETEQRAKLQAYAFIAKSGLIREFKRYCEDTQEYTWQMFHEAFLNAF